MALNWDPWAVPNLLAFLLAIGAAIAVLATAPTRSANRRLAAVLALEGCLLFTGVFDSFVYGGEGSFFVDALGLASAVTLTSAYFLFLSILETPLVRPLRSRAAIALLCAYPPVVIGWELFNWIVRGAPRNVDSGIGTLAVVLLLAVNVFGLIAAISAWRRTPKGTPSHARAGAFLAAFGLRDAGWLIHIGAFFTVVALTGENEVRDTHWWQLALPIIVFLYVPVLAYGILRTQLFDIDLKIKIGIRRGTVVGIILIAVFVAAKVVEVYLNRTVGVIAGSVVAGSLLFLVPKLNKLGEKVASTALPKVENTSAYVEFRKLEVYKAALESALEGGELTDKERETLRRLRTKLGISEADATALEGDVRERLVPA